MAPSPCIVIPAYRPDVEALSAYVRAIDEELRPAVVRIELDDPEEGVPEALADLPASVHTSARRRGKGAAITYGFEALDGDVLAFVDADGSTPVDALADVLDPVLAGRADLAIGSRRHPEAEIRSNQSVLRQALGDGFAWLARRLLGTAFHDYQCGAKAISREGWARVRHHLYQPGFAWDIELVAMATALDLRIEEVPIAWEDRPESTVDPVDAAVELFRALLISRHRMHRIRGSALHSTIADRRDEVALVDRPSSTRD